MIRNTIPADILDTVYNDKSRYSVSSITIRVNKIISSPYPILCPNNNIATKFNYDTVEYINNTLNNFDLRESGLIVAGGIFTSPNMRSDIDVFAVANNEENAMKNINKLILHMKKQENDATNTMLYINPSSITMNIYLNFDSTLNPVQIITIRYYETPMDVINDFDLGSSMIFYDGYDVYTNSLGKFALEYGVNIINFNKIHNSTDKRLWKYYYRGYSIMLPHLNVNKLWSAQNEINKINEINEINEINKKSKKDNDKCNVVKINSNIGIIVFSPPVNNIIMCKIFCDIEKLHDSNYSENLDVIQYCKGCVNIYSLLSGNYFINECIKLSEFTSVHERFRVSYNLDGLNYTSKLYLLLLTSKNVSSEDKNTINTIDYSNNKEKIVNIIKKLITPDKEFYTIHFNDQKMKDTLPKNMDKLVWYGDFIRDDVQ